MQDLEAEKRLADSRRAAAEAALAKAKEALQQRDLEHANAVHAAREAEWERVREAEEKLLTAEQALHREQTQAKAAAETHAAKMEQVKASLEEAVLARDAEKRDAARLRRDAETLRQKAGQLEQLQETHNDTQQQLAKYGGAMAWKGQAGPNARSVAAPLDTHLCPALCRLESRRTTRASARATSSSWWETGRPRCCQRAVAPFPHLRQD